MKYLVIIEKANPITAPMCRISQVVSLLATRSRRPRK